MLRFMIKLWSLLTENFQLANKVYAGQLSAADIDFLTTLCNKDYTFKTLTDLLMEEKSNTGGWPWTVKQWQKTVIQLRNYNKNVFPIQNFITTFAETKSTDWMESRTGIKYKFVEYKRK